MPVSARAQRGINAKQPAHSGHFARETARGQFGVLSTCVNQAGGDSSGWRCGEDSFCALPHGWTMISGSFIWPPRSVALR
jgi:hypothetical protein